MMSGIVSENRLPTIKLNVEGLTELIDVIVDTGFSGSLCLSQKHAMELALKPVAVDWYELGDGTLVETNVYIISVL